MSKLKKFVITSLIFSSLFVTLLSKSYADSIILNKDLTDGVNVRVKEDIDSEILGGIEDFKIYDIKSESENRYEVEFEGKKGFVGKDRFYRLSDTSTINDTNLRKTATEESENTLDYKLKKNTKVTILGFDPETDFVKVKYDLKNKDNKILNRTNSKNTLNSVEIDSLKRSKVKEDTKENLNLPQVIILDEPVNPNFSNENKENLSDYDIGFIKLSSLAISKKNKDDLNKFISYYKNANDSINNHKEMEKLDNESYNLESIDNNQYEIITDEPSTMQISDAIISIDDPEYITVSVTGSDIGIDMYEWALQYLGNPYVWGGISPTDGIDCSGFTMQIYRSIGIDLPHFAQSQQNYGVEIPFGSEMAGDLVFFGTSLNNITHVGMADGNGNMIHASSPSTGIIISPIYDPISIKRIVK